MVATADCYRKFKGLLNKLFKVYKRQEHDVSNRKAIFVTDKKQNKNNDKKL